VRPFDVCGPLPSGVTVLEASAGTGKTFTIAALAARYVAEGTSLDRLLLVTFTRMATGELRERVRERLVSAEQALDRVLAGAPPDERDAIARLLASADVQVRRDRLARAVADFDAATIATTHGFCQEVLSGLGVVGDVAPDLAFVEDVDDLLAEVVDDLYVRRFYRHGVADFDRAEAMLIARAAVENPGAPIEPANAPADSIAAMRRRLAEVVRKELAERKRRAGVVSYDDLLTRLAEVLRGPGGAAATAQLRARYSVVLVDEFQDTDPIQWDILRRAFGGSGVTLVLIGDPKQAVYAFRGADVYAYLAAARAADARATLEVNWRSDQGLIDAYDALFGGARLGHEGIVYRRVRAADANVAPRLAGAPVAAPLRLRVVHRGEPSVGITPQGYARVSPARAHVTHDLAAELVRLLSSGAEIELRRDDVAERTRLRPGHVAVLVRTNRAAVRVRDALEAAGLPAVISGAGSVFATDAARDWLRLLEAIERPAYSPSARAAALTPFLGWSASRVALASEQEWEEIHRRLHEWARVLREQGVAAMAEAISMAERLPGRVLSRVDGERRLTDLRHVGELLHAAATAEQLGATALTAWLRARIAAADDETGDEERSRRLESDAEAIQVLTIHRSKGLEFPVVLFPDLWEPSWIADRRVPVAYHDPDAGDERTIDVGLDGPDFPRHQQQHMVEQRGEDLRLAYVALTRAQHQAVVWWVGSWASQHAPLTRLLFSRDDDGFVAPRGRFTPSDAAVTERLEALAQSAPGCISVERSTLELPLEWSAATPAPAGLEAARFTRSLDMGWRRTSYSDLTAAAHEAAARVASEPEEPVVADEPVDSPGGVEFGTFVHRVLEATDFAAQDLDAELTLRVAEARARRRVDVGDSAAVVAALRAAIDVPLGPLVGGVRLRDLGRADRLDELAFELPLAGGDKPAGRRLALGDIGETLRRFLRQGDPLAGYAERLGDPALVGGDVRGYLTGSIDLVARVGANRFAVVDYKTNRLAAGYAAHSLAAEMQRMHYGLQALLYLVALHRYLRWRLPQYDPHRQLAGVLYLFLRGMDGGDEFGSARRHTSNVGRSGAGSPEEVNGVFAWSPPARLVEALSDVLDQGAAE
jgi:exodeoxyribonuclease V beta subunit